MQKKKAPTVYLFKTFLFCPFTKQGPQDDDTEAAVQTGETAFSEAYTIKTVISNAVLCCKSQGKNAASIMEKCTPH